MNCRHFQHHMADWVAGRLSEEQAALMETHRAVCPVCARAEEEERDLHARWHALAVPANPPDLWPRIAARLETPTPARTPRFAFARRLALSGAVAAAGAICALLWARLEPVPQEDAVDEQRVVQLIGAMQQIPDPDVDAPGPSPWEESRILIGGFGK